jgi:hypothetical protein
MGRTIAAVVAFAVAFGTSNVARAEALTELLPRLVREGGWLRAHYPGEPKQPARDVALLTTAESAAPARSLGDELHVSIVARDWREAYSLTDGRPLLFDRVRLIRSSRMAVTRVSLAGGRFLPYAEASFGQWRADTELVPWLKSDAEMAGQVAAGFELHVAPRCAFAWDLEETQIYSGQQNVPATRLFASFAALRADF